MKEPSEYTPDLLLFSDQGATKPLKEIDWKESTVTEGHIAIAEFYIYNSSEWDYGITGISYVDDDRPNFSLSSDWIYPHRTVKVVMKFLVPTSSNWREMVRNALVANKVQINGYYLQTERIQP